MMSPMWGVWYEVTSLDYDYYDYYYYYDDDYLGEAKEREATVQSGALLQHALERREVQGALQRLRQHRQQPPHRRRAHVEAKGGSQRQLRRRRRRRRLRRRHLRRRRAGCGGTLLPSDRGESHGGRDLIGWQLGRE